MRRQYAARFQVGAMYPNIILTNRLQVAAACRPSVTAIETFYSRQPL